MLEIPLTCGLVCPQDYTFKILTIELKKKISAINKIKNSRQRLHYKGRATYQISYAVRHNDAKSTTPHPLLYASFPDV